MEELALIIIGILVGAIVVMVVFALGTPTRTEAVCHYLHGQVHGDVCIRDGKVVDTKPH